MRMLQAVSVMVLFAGVAAAVYAQGVSVAVVDYPREVQPYDYFNPVWAVDAGGQKVEESGIVWGTAPGGASMEAYPFRSVGRQEGKRYTTSIKAFPETRLFEPEEVALIYFRAYAVVGGKPYFSGEENLYVYNHRRTIIP